jgi:hypothetical protein
VALSPIFFEDREGWWTETGILWIDFLMTLIWVAMVIVYIIIYMIRKPYHDTRRE